MRKLLAQSSAVIVHSFLIPQKPQRNHFVQQSWPNLFLGRWLEGLSFLGKLAIRAVRSGI